jgi:hypothetical protein
MDFGIAMATAADSWKIVERAEALGFSHAWFYDTQMLSADCFVAIMIPCVYGETIYTKAGSKYVGDVVNGVPHGQGTFTWAGGRKYVGELKDGKLHGQGTKTWVDGRKYVGEWEDLTYPPPRTILLFKLGLTPVEGRADTPFFQGPRCSASLTKHLDPVKGGRPMLIAD